VSVRQSVRQDYVVCLDCGYRATMLRRHISARHSLNPDEYLKRWGLRRDHPLSAPAYSEQRSTMAKQLGLGRKPKGAGRPRSTGFGRCRFEDQGETYAKSGHPFRIEIRGGERSGGSADARDE
jgi:hypothetical protein